MESVADGGVLNLLEPRERRDAGGLVHGSLVAQRSLRTDARELALQCTTKEERVLDPLVVLPRLAAPVAPGEASALPPHFASLLRSKLAKPQEPQ